MMYRFIKPILFSFQAEKIHHLIVKLMKFGAIIPGFNKILSASFTIKDPALERVVFGIRFPNPVGLAAGFDKDASCFQQFFNLGFGFIEIGTLTPKAQTGNPKPRLFRLKEDEALINRMGFNNNGVHAAAINLSKYRKPGMIIGGNIGKNKFTPNELASEDYGYCFESLFPFVDYFVVNVSSPNTAGLRELQEKKPLTELLNYIQVLNNKKQFPKPVLLKIAPDLNFKQLDDIIEIVQKCGISGIVATNTSLSREALTASEHLKNESGGLSGKPVRQRSTEVISYLHRMSNASFPIIGVGGIHSATDALEKFEAGASLIQIYTGFIYEGPSLVRRINKALLQAIKSRN